MATHFHTTHAGLGRLIAGASAAKGAFSDIFSAKHLPTYILAATIMAVVTTVERAIDVAHAGFTFEWAALTIVALLTFGLLSNAVVRSTRASQNWYAEYTGRTQQLRADARLWAEARRDPRVMSDIVAAEGRQGGNF